MGYDQVSLQRRRIALIVLPLVVAAMIAAWWPYRYLLLPMPGVTRKVKVGGLQREFQFFVPAVTDADRGQMPVVVLLQGFDSAIIADHTREMFWKFCEAAERNRFALVMPRGLQGSFGEIPEVIAWYPEYLVENLRYLKELPEHLNKETGAGSRFAADRLYFVGYSNGAYFGAIALMNYPQMPFLGYWLEAGGFPYAFNELVPKRKVFINAGSNDLYNIEHIRKLGEALRNHGWETGKNLIYREHPGTHIFDFAVIDEALRFLLTDHDRPGDG